MFGGCTRVASATVQAAVAAATVVVGSVLWGGIAAAGTQSPAAAVTCERETHTWTGDETVSGPADVIATGVDIDAALGTTLVAVGSSADGLDSINHAVDLPVSVGDDLVVAGAALGGGQIMIHGPIPGSAVGPLTVSGATVVVDRCWEVAVGGDTTTTVAPSTTAAATTAAPTTTVVIDGGAGLPTTTVASVAPAATTLPVATGNDTLPATGSSDVVALLAALLVGAGGVLSGVIGRRRPSRPTAGGPEPGLRPGARPPVPH